MRNTLKSGLVSSPSFFDEEAIKISFSPNLILENPTILALSHWLDACLFSKDGVASLGIRNQMARTQRLVDMVMKYTRDLSIREGLRGLKQPDPACVLLTGLTGNLGSYPLEHLIGNPRVERVWALNRSHVKITLLNRQRRAVEDQAIDKKLLQSGKLRLLEGEVSRIHFGLSNEHWQEVNDLRGSFCFSSHAQLCSTATLAIHN
jgi:hypothetical protein